MFVGFCMVCNKRYAGDDTIICGVFNRRENLTAQYADFTKLPPNVLDQDAERLLGRNVGAL